MTQRPLGSIIIAAHDEEAVIGRTLGRLQEAVAQGAVEVIVVCNGCTDRTFEVARGFPGVRVLDLREASKSAALRAGDRVVGPGPRIYLDADIDMTSRAAIDTLRALRAGAVAARPPRRFDSAGAQWVVRRWYHVRRQLTSTTRALWGAGCYALSETGRARFSEFPEVTADDLFIQSFFAPEEVTIVQTDPVVVRTPRTLRALLRIRRRVYRSHVPASARVGADGGTRESSGGALVEIWDLIRRDQVHVLDGVIYAGVIAVARVGARLRPNVRWERDDTSRTGG